MSIDRRICSLYLLSARDHLQAASNDADLLSKFITASESWFHDYNHEIKQQSSQLKSPNLLNQKSEERRVAHANYFL